MSDFIYGTFRILLGSPFDISKFEKVSNYTVKPLGGLWVAPYDLNEYISKWHEFLENEYYRTYNVTNGYFYEIPLKKDKNSNNRFI